MRIRFLQTTPSGAPDVPFQPGQIISLTGLTPECRRWFRDGLAELLRDEPLIETAAVATDGQPRRELRRRAVKA